MKLFIPDNAINWDLKITKIKNYKVVPQCSHHTQY